LKREEDAIEHYGQLFTGNRRKRRSLERRSQVVYEKLGRINGANNLGH
jgi:hypothetical protein